MIAHPVDQHEGPVANAAVLRSCSRYDFYSDSLQFCVSGRLEPGSDGVQGSHGPQVGCTAAAPVAGGCPPTSLVGSTMSVQPLETPVANDAVGLDSQFFPVTGRRFRAQTVVSSVPSSARGGTQHRDDGSAPRSSRSVLLDQLACHGWTRLLDADPPWSLRMGPISAAPGSLSLSGTTSV